MSRCGTPILFLIFNRPEQTARVMAALRELRPARLFIAADGPRLSRPDDAELCRKTREAGTNVDWPCEVHTLLREENLGCGPAVSGAISWFFEHVEEGIILEDDCLPHPDFFPYCETLLERHRDDERIATIGGSHFFPGPLNHERSHYASKYFQMWGWASWRRFWKHYDYKLEALDAAAWSNLLGNVHPRVPEANYWRHLKHCLATNQVNTWDFQVFFTAWRLGSVHLSPGRNLISNIGFAADATHTAFDSPMANLPIFPLTVGDAPVPLTPDPVLESMIFHVRFLESLQHPGILEWMLRPGSAGARPASSDSPTVRNLEVQLAEARRQLRQATDALARLPVGKRRGKLRRILPW